MKELFVVWLRSRESTMPTKEGSSSVSEPSDDCLALLEQLAWLPLSLLGEGAVLLVKVVAVLSLLRGRD